MPTKVRATGTPMSFSRRTKPSTISSSGRLRRPESASQSASSASFVTMAYRAFLGPAFCRQRGIDNDLRLMQECPQSLLAAQTLGVDLVDDFGTGGARGEPTPCRDDLY